MRSILEVGLEPGVFSASDSIMVKFCDEYFMINSVKSLLEVDENTTGELTFIKSFSNVFSNVDLGINSGVGFSETKLFRVDLIEAVEKVHYPGVSCFLINFFNV